MSGSRRGSPISSAGGGRRFRRPASRLRGELPIAVGDRIFRLIGRADRIERLVQGGYAILDFKTGTPPTDKQVQIGVAPQLALEAAMLRGGAFRGIAGTGRSVAELVYVKLKGGEPPGEAARRRLQGRERRRRRRRGARRLTTLVTRFEDENTPYHSLVLSMWTHRYGAYDDLARVKEWSFGGAEGGEE